MSTLYSAADLVRAVLADEGLGTFAATAGWAIHVAAEPKAPRTTITIYDAGGGRLPDPGTRLDEPQVQVRVRAPSYVEALAKLGECRDVLHNRPRQAVDGADVLGIWCIANPFSLGLDDNGNHRLTLDFRLMIRPPAGTHRIGEQRDPGAPSDSISG